MASIEQETSSPLIFAQSLKVSLATAKSFPYCFNESTSAFLSITKVPIFFFGSTGLPKARSILLNKLFFFFF